MSPVLIRKAAMVAGMRDERVIHQMQQTAVLSLAMKAQQQALNQGTTLGSQLNNQGQQAPGATQVSQMASPTVAQTQKQLEQQLQ
jgi:hypothetical protein